VTMQFRNVDFDRSASIDEWPPEAIETIIERGSIVDWRELAGAIRANPWGPAARATENVVSWDEHYGVDRLLARVLKNARERVAREGRERYAAQIRAWRARTGLSLREFARAAGTSAPRLSDYENSKVAPTTDVLGRLRHVAQLYARDSSKQNRPSEVTGKSARGAKRARTTSEGTPPLDPAS
jgi:DNA-binding transcriptional regulator YiaG